jgi:hypothetical protein
LRRHAHLQSKGLCYSSVLSYKTIACLWHALLFKEQQIFRWCNKTNGYCLCFRTLIDWSTFRMGLWRSP